MLRAILMACVIALVFGCAARKAQETPQAPWARGQWYRAASAAAAEHARREKSDGSPVPSTAQQFQHPL